MKMMLNALAPVVLLTPALAHDGPHAHPHGLEGAVGIGVAILIGMAVIVAFRSR